MTDEHKPTAEDIVAEHAPDAPDAPKKSVATRLVDLALERYSLGCTPDGEPYAIPHEGPPVVRQLRGGRGSLRVELAEAYFSANGHAASQSALTDALMVIEGKAQRCQPVELHLRVAGHGAALVLDLGDATGRAITITSAGWQIVDRPPVRFRRTAATGTLPEPERGCKLDVLWQAINVAERYQPLVLAVLIAELFPDLPHPIVAVTGEHGTGKSTATRRLASIIDPSPAPLRKPPRDVEAWTTAAAGSWVVALDNLTSVPDWLSDALCRASTGDGDIRRRLYTDGDLHVIAFRRAVMINGIDLGALNGDLADRLVHIVLDLITSTKRRPELALTAAWKRTHPRVLGAVLDLAVKVLAVLPTIDLSELPRMADYARILAAVDKVQETNGMATYCGLADELAWDAITSDPVCVAITRTIREEWKEGTAAELLTVITPLDEHGRPPKDWPKPRALTAMLRRAAPALRRLGWTVTEKPREDSRDKVLRWTLKPPPDDEPREDAKNAVNAADAAQEGVCAGHSAAACAATGAATVRQQRGDAAPSAATAATPPNAAPVAAPNAAPNAPNLTSRNKDHAASAAKAAPNPPSLGSWRDGADAALALLADELGATPTRTPLTDLDMT